ncbi:unnamed protein product [Orchesella dallaii]|uniref:C2H2-type domain-containing protein n=1 Tax=Orchesella dallaii TaxID=48710 RepID=A0ABP1PTF6_9HEXA
MKWEITSSAPLTNGDDDGEVAGPSRNMFSSIPNTTSTFKVDVKGEDVESKENGEAMDGGEEIPSSAPLTNGDDDGQVAGPSKCILSATTKTPSSPSQLATDTEPERGLISVVDLRTITEKDDDEGEEDHDDRAPSSPSPPATSSSRLPPRPIRYDPTTIKECYVHVIRLEYDLSVVGPRARDGSHQESTDTSNVVVLPQVRSGGRQENVKLRRSPREKGSNPKGEHKPQKPPRLSTLSRPRSIKKGKQEASRRSARNMRKKQVAAGSSKKTKSPKNSQPNRQNRLKCKRCEKTFANQYSLNRHQLCHSGVKKFECKPCQLRFARMDHYRTHLLSKKHKRIFANSKN